jgi:hypothetical protein
VVAGAVYEEFYLNSSNKSVVTVQPTKKPRRAKEEEA